MRTPRPAIIVVLTLLSWAAFGCGDDGTGPSDTPASIVLTPPSASIPAGGTVSLAAVVKNRNGEPLNGVSLTYASSATEVATVSSAGVVTSMGPAGTATITASGGGVTSNAVAITVTSGAVGSAAKVADFPPAPAAGSAHTLSVKVVDAFSNPVAGVAVTFAVTGGRGTATPTSAVTDVQGMASTSVKLADTVGVNTFTAAVAGLPEAVAFTATSVAGTVTQLTKVGTDPASVMATTAFPDSLRVRAADAFGNPKAGVAVSFVVTAGGGVVSPAAATTDAAGRAAARFVTGAAVGVTNSVTATVAGLAPVTFSSVTTPLVRDLAYRTYSTSSARPAVVLANGDSVWTSYWTTSGRTGAAYTQAAYEDARRGIHVRVLYDAEEVPSRIVDMNTGQQIVVVPRDNRIDYLVYDRNGGFVDGVALVAQGSGLYLARIQSSPSFAGQINALSDRVSLSLLSLPESGLGPLVAAPAGFVSFYNQATGAAGAPFRVAGSDPLLAFASTAALRRALTKAGLTLMGTGVALPALGIAAGTLPLGLFCGGLAIVALGNVPNFGLDGVDQFSEGLNALFQEGVATDQTPEETLNSASTSLFGSGTLLLTNLKKAVTQAGDAVRDRIASFVSPGAVNTTSGGPPVGTSQVEGYGVDRDNRLYLMNGQVSPSGQVSASGSSGGGSLSITGTVTETAFNGSYSGTPGSGTLTGSTKPLGQCQSVTASGGQGTFAQAYNMGTTMGAVSFFYDAYTIKDAFQVATAGATVFTTGGLVSGRRTVSFDLVGSSIVFVTVTAPTSGTAWEFKLGCPTGGSTGEPRITLSSATRTFSVAEGASPAPQTVSVTNGGGGTLSGLSVGSITYGPGANGWLSANLSSSTAPATLTLTPQTAQLGPGTYSATVPVRSSVSGVQNSPQNVSVFLQVTAAGSLSVTTLPAGAFGVGGMRMNGRSNGGGSDYAVWFEWGASSSLATYSSTGTLANTAYNCSSTENCSWYWQMPGLYGNTLYHFRIAGQAGATIRRGDILSYTTPAPAAPAVTADSTVLLASGSVLLYATLDPNGADVTFRTEVSASPDMSNATAGVPRTETPRNAYGTWWFTWSGFQPATTYYWRVVASNSAGTTTGAVRSFTTAASASGAAGAPPRPGAGAAALVPADARRTEPAGGGGGRVRR